MIKLGDFGIAKVLEKTMDKAQTMVGSPYYISPEIINNRPYSFKSDIWSLGVILYELCALRPPFTGSMLHMLALNISKGVYTPIPNQYSSGLNDLIKNMLDLNPDTRPDIHEILKKEIIQNRIQDLLSKTK